MLKRLLKVLLAIVALVVLAAGAFVLYVHLDWPMRRAVAAPDIKVEITPERLVRGRQLVTIRCAACHYDQKTGGLTGHHLVDTPTQFGTFYSHNITRDPVHGLGRYSDGELLFLLRTGIRRDGVFTGPMMISPNTGDEDLYAIIAFLRSDDPLTAPRDVTDRPTEATLLYKFLAHVAFKPLPYPTAKIAVPDLRDPVAYGRYVVNGMADCFVCHSADFKTLDSVHPENSAGYLGGGNSPLDANGNVVRGANITMDPETGIGKWTEAEFVKTLRTGFLPDHRPLRYPMTPYSALSEEEARAVFAYLKTVPVIRNQVERDVDGHPAMGASASEGEKLYNKYYCYSCHGSSGVGVCDLRDASKRYDTDEKLSAFIHDASKYVKGTMMPTWEGMIAETEYSALIAHVRALERAQGSSPAK